MRLHFVPWSVRHSSLSSPSLECMPKSPGSTVGHWDTEPHPGLVGNDDEGDDDTPVPGFDWG